jgi:transcriptional regulator with XRE-family HTH domain
MNAPIKGEAMTTEAKLGPALLALRRRNNWTLSDVSKKTGLSISTLSKTERNQLSLTYEKLRRLAEGLGVDITTFFDGDGGAGAESGAGARRSVNRATDGRIVDTPNYLHVYLNTDLLKKKFIPIVVDVKARSLAEFGPLVRHAGEEFAYVLDGTVTVHTEHYAPVALAKGESIYFDSQMAHGYVAAGDGPCRILSISSAPEAALMETMNRHFGTAADPPAEIAPRTRTQPSVRRRAKA